MDPSDSRPFGFWTATALVVGGMIGTGIFLIPASLAPFGWTGVAGWLISIGGALSIAYALGRLAAILPQTTGAVAITGEVLGVVPGLLIGWSYWVSCWSSVAALGIGAASYIAVFVPAIATQPLAGGLTAVGLIWALTLLNLAGARRVGDVQVVTTVLKLLPLAAVIAIAASLGARGAAAVPPVPPLPALGAGLGAAVTLTLFPLVGFEAAGVAASRVRDPQRNVIRATMAGTAATGLIFLLVCSAIVLMLPPAAVASSPAPFQLFVQHFWGRGPALAVAAFAAVSAIGALNCWVLIQGEVPLGMARAGLLPRSFARVSRRDVPVAMLILSSALASLLVLSNSSKTLGGVFVFVILLSTCTTLWLYLAICVAALIRRVAMPAAAVGVPFCLFAFWGAGAEASLLSLVLMLSAVPLYLLRGRRRGAVAGQAA